MSTTIQNFYKTTITRNWTATTGDFNVAIAPTPTSGWLVVSPNNSTLREIVYYSATGSNAYGAFITISNIAHRGIGGTTAQTHSIGESIRMNITAEHWDEMQDDINNIVAAGAADAGISTKGIVEEATDAEMLTGTATGSTGAKLFVTPEKLATLGNTTVNISSAEILAIHTTPIEVIAAPGAGKIIIVEEMVFFFDVGTPYTSGTDILLRYAGDTTQLTTAIGNSIITGASDAIGIRTPQNNLVDLSAGINKAVQLQEDTANDYITGTGTLKLFIKYRIVTL